MSSEEEPKNRILQHHQEPAINGVKRNRIEYQKEYRSGTTGVERQRSLEKMRVKVVETFGVVLGQKRGTIECPKEAEWRAQHRPKAL
jgi:hypothetical protein